MNKKILIIILLFIILAPLIIIIVPVIKNNNYDKSLQEKVLNNTDIKEITDVSKDNNYYIVKTKEKVLVLDLNYDEVYTIDISSLHKSKLELSYVRNKLYYKEIIKDKNKLTYKYYDVLTMEEVYISILGGSYE